jgi:hypothetical protein
MLTPACEATCPIFMPVPPLTLDLGLEFRVLDSSDATGVQTVLTRELSWILK